MSPRRTRARPAHAVPEGDGGEQPLELAGVARRAGVRVSLVRRYLEFGLFDPCAGPDEPQVFEPSCAARLAAAERLRRDLGLNFAGAVLACELLDRVYQLEERLGRGRAVSDHVGSRKPPPRSLHGHHRSGH